MAAVNFYFEYRNAQRVHLPVNPEKLEIQAPGENSTIDIINLGATSILKNPGLKTLSFETFIPAANSGSYVQAGATIFDSSFYRDFFQAVQNQKEPVNFIVTGLGISMKVSIEDFNFWWEGSDPDMHFKISLKEYRKSTIKITAIGTSTAASISSENANSSRGNTSKKVTIGSRVRVNGQLHRDSYGNGPGVTEKDAIRKVNFIKTGRECPYHVTTLEGGWRGWVKASAVEVVD